MNPSFSGQFIIQSSLENHWSCSTRCGREEIQQRRSRIAVFDWNRAAQARRRGGDWVTHAAVAATLTVFIVADAANAPTDVAGETAGGLNWYGLTTGQPHLLRSRWRVVACSSPSASYHAARCRAAVATPTTAIASRRKPRRRPPPRAVTWARLRHRRRCRACRGARACASCTGGASRGGGRTTSSRSKEDY